LPIRVIDFMSLTQTLQFDEVVSALKLTEVEHLKHNDLRSLSGGEFQRVLMARAIAKKPDLLVLDEPVQGVDFTGEIALYELIKKISDELNCGILLISHDLNVVMSKTDYVVCLNGHVCCSGTPMNVANNKNYKELFGDQASTLLSVYEHKHDHTHATDGSIKEKKTLIMLDDFFIRALIAGIGIALVAGPLGCFVIWRRLSFFGDTLSHSALLGVTLALSFDINIALSVFFVSSAVALVLLKLQKTTNLPGDALLGLLAHSSLAVGLVVISFLSFIRFDIMGLLFGDILAVAPNDIFIIWIGGVLILLVLKIIWKPLFASTVNYELAEAEGMNPARVNAIFTILMAAIIAISIKMVGLLLITGMLIIPAAMARNLSNNPVQMVVYSVIGGLLSVIVGLFASLELNSPSGPSIITAALVLFILSLTKINKFTRLKN
jgi:zinc transport system permease protein